MAAIRHVRLFVAAFATLVSALVAASPDTPEQVYAKLHAAELAGDFEGMKKYLAAENVQFLNAAQKDPEQMEMVELMRRMLPPTYVVERATIDRDGNKATLELTGMRQSHAGKAPAKVAGKIALVRERGEWKIDSEDWGRSGRSAHPKPEAK